MPNQNKNLKLKIFFLTIIFCGMFGVAKKSFGATINAASCSQEDVQAAINASSDDDIVYVPEGSCVWSSEVILINKDISVIGAGIDQTNIGIGQTNGFHVVNTEKSNFRISGFTFTGDQSGNPYVIWVNSNTSDIEHKGWRVDHIKFNFGDNNVHGIGVWGINYGLIDNCIFNGVGYVAVQVYAALNSEWHGAGDTYYGDTIWATALNLGSDEAVYIENCTFNFQDGAAADVFDSVYGGKVVFRYNEVHRATIVTHSTRGDDRGGLKQEIYNNSWIGVEGGYPNPGLIRSGTGVIFNNTIVGYDNPHFIVDDQRTCVAFEGRFPRCTGNVSYDGNTSGEYGWPCLDQIGRGSGVTVGQIQPSVPLYGWNNGPEITCSQGDACTVASAISVNGDFDLCLSDAPPSLATHIKTINDADPHAGGIVDYINNGATPKPGYVPYAYPHPLRNEGTDITPPSSPIGLVVE